MVSGSLYGSLIALNIKSPRPAIPAPCLYIYPAKCRLIRQELDGATRSFVGAASAPVSISQQEQEHRVSPLQSARFAYLDKVRRVSQTLFRQPHNCF